MSGLAGIVVFGGRPVDAAQVRLMTGAMPHRALDGISFVDSRQATLGHCLTAVTSEDRASRQPMREFSSKISCVIAGRLDNFSDLRRDLIARGRPLRSQSDAELVLRSYEVWAVDAIRRFMGDFAIAIWDENKGQLLLARDHFGAKPLFFHRDGDRLAFASEVGAILALPWVRRERDDEALLSVDPEFAAERTDWREIQRVPPAHVVAFSRDRSSSLPYWSPDFSRTERHKTQQDYVERYRSLLFASVRQHSRTPNALACEVSGGLDSSGVYGVASSLLRTGELMAPALQGYTLRFPSGDAADELSYVRAIARFCGTEIREVPPEVWSPEQYLEYSAKHVVPAPAPNGVMHQSLNSAARDDGSRVILTGLGGDEWSSGGPRYADFLQEGDWKAIRELIFTEIAVLGVLATSWAVFRSGIVPLLPASLKTLLYPRRAARNAAVRQSDCDSGGAIRLSGQRRHSNILRDRNRLIARESSEYLNALAGIEMRSPLWSLPLVEFAIATPAGRKERAGIDRLLHREALRGLVPACVRQRTTKAEFNFAYARTLASMRPTDPWAHFAIDHQWVTRAELDQMFSELSRKRTNSLVEFRIWKLFSQAALASA